MNSTTFTVQDALEGMIRRIKRRGSIQRIINNAVDKIAKLLWFYSFRNQNLSRLKSDFIKQGMRISSLPS